MKTNYQTSFEGTAVLTLENETFNMAVLPKNQRDADALPMLKPVQVMLRSDNRGVHIYNMSKRRSHVGRSVLLFSQETKEKSARISLTVNKRGRVCMYLTLRPERLGLSELALNNAIADHAVLAMDYITLHHDQLVETYDYQRSRWLAENEEDEDDEE